MKSFVEKETLIKEIHHRVKNNLQLVMSLLYIQSKSKKNNIQEFIEISNSRIMAMSLVHENLHQVDDLSSVDFKEYTTRLLQTIHQTYSNSEQYITLHQKIDNLYIDIQTAVPLGLIINELISNAYKHAFIGKQEGTITIRLSQNGDLFELVIKDNGIGINETKKESKSLGQVLVQQLVQQINGTLAISHSKGTKFKIKFQNLKI